MICNFFFPILCVVFLCLFFLSFLNWEVDRGSSYLVLSHRPALAGARLRPKLGAWDSGQASHLGGRGLVSWAIGLSPMVCMSRKVESAHKGTPVSGQYLNSWVSAHLMSSHFLHCVLWSANVFHVHDVWFLPLIADSLPIMFRKQFPNVKWQMFTVFS